MAGALLSASACQNASGSISDAPHREGSVADAGPLPERAQVVASADQLALAGMRQGGPSGAESVVAAARLRERLWRLEGREADALEAVELFQAAARLDRSRSCGLGTARALLEGEVRHKPSLSYELLYSLRAREATGPCKERIAGLLARLEAFKPPPAVLSRLVRDAGASADAGGGHAATRDVTGAIVVPKVVQQRPSRITKVEHYGSEDAGRVVVYVTHPAVFEVGALPGTSSRGPRLYVDIKGATYKGAESVEGQGLVERVRLGQGARAARVVLDLAQPVFRKVFYLPEPFRLIIDVSRERPEPVRQDAEGPRNIRRVVLDPGHGGEDPGAVGPAGLREKDVALDIAHRAAPLIAREVGVSTLLTRDADVFVPLDERVARANAFGADLFVSIHCNASEAQSSHGIMTFVLDSSRDDLAGRIAARENAASAAAAAELANIMSHVLDADLSAQSAHFARLLQRSAMASMAEDYQGVTDLGVRSAGFYVLAGARMPATLFEASFISHPLEETRLNTGHYRQKVADAIVNAVRAFRDGH